jgi:hypothetical protein
MKMVIISVMMIVSVKAAKELQQCSTRDAIRARRRKFS